MSMTVVSPIETTTAKKSYTHVHAKGAAKCHELAAPFYYDY